MKPYLTSRETASDMSDPVVIPKAPKPAFDLEAFKNAAKQEITAAANTKKSAIDNNTALTAEEKQTAKNAVDAAATQANRNIDSATNQAGVDTAKNNGKQAINAVPVNGTAKAAANTKKSAIDNNTALTAEEKQTAKNAVDTEATKAKAAIDKATDQAGVNSAKAAGKQAIENVPTTATSKDAAKQEITNAAEAKKTAIDGQAGLTSEEKQTAKNAVDTEATKAKAAAKAEVAKAAIAAVNAINEAKDQAGVDSAQTTGVKAIEAVNPVGKGSTNNEGHVITPPTVEVPAYIGSVNGISEETPAKPDYDGSANEMPERTPISETAINKDRQLPKTGTADSTAAMVAAAASAVLGLALAGRRRKEDEEV